ncbi:uncharacterized protein E0L32_005740 [Thyridium curvatum]|uniref:N-acetyltransferase domain-containing protein n=1 Tax=Thyridium curvatum TaxID=1093900 RepID=A0A507B402_9PEZI|nr:uncharacterized protein E0L32_005740 [Thyridium curvatum]TPX13796.1 hypothetical protein E0L32_005740 [Thyridium curvatum]
MDGQAWASTGWDNSSPARQSPTVQQDLIRDGTDKFKLMVLGEASGGAAAPGTNHSMAVAGQSQARTPIAPNPSASQEIKPMFSNPTSPWNLFARNSQKANASELPMPGAASSTKPGRFAGGPPRARNYEKYSMSEKSMPSAVIGSDDDNNLAQRVGKVDIRGHIAPPHILENFGGKWIKATWGNDDDDDHEELLASESFLNPFVLSWQETIPRNICVDLADPEPNSPHWTRDIDTTTGKFIDQIHQPPTMVGEESLSAQEMQHRFTWTSTSLGRLEYKRYKKGLRRFNAVPEDYGMVPLSEEPYRPRPKPYTTKIPCLVRPANIEDMASALEIYNHEVSTGTQAWDVDVLQVEDFNRIFNGCKEGQLPFIVAVASSDAAPAPPSGQQALDKIVAFGFLSTYDLGLSRSMYGTGRYSVKANVYVHSEYRRKRVGSAVLDRLLRYSLHTYDPQHHYMYQGPKDDPVYMPATSAQSRLYYRVYVELLFRGAQDPQREWYGKLLGQFGFTCKADGLDYAHRTTDAPGVQGEALDKVIYQYDYTDDRGVLKSRQPLRRPGLNVSS